MDTREDVPEISRVGGGSGGSAGLVYMVPSSCGVCEHAGDSTRFETQDGVSDDEVCDAGFCDVSEGSR